MTFVKKVRVFKTGVPLIVIALVLGGCIRGDDYYYVLIDSAEFEVARYGQAEKGKSFFFLRSHKEMPVEYILERDSYRVLATIDVDEKVPQITITATANEGTELLLFGTTDHDCVGLFYDRYHRRLSEWSPRASITYKWMRSRTPECQRSTIPVDQPLSWNIDVVDVDGNLLGEELVTFSVRQNGRYYYLDGV